MRGYAERLLARKQDRSEEVDQDLLQQAKVYTDWAQSPCYKKRVDSLEERLRCLNRKSPTSGEEALLLQGERKAIQEELDLYDADLRDAHRVMEKQIQRAV